MTMKQAAQRMPPIDTPHSGNAGFLPTLLPEFIGEKESDNNQRQYEKGP